jgi:hypothetical protein
MISGQMELNDEWSRDPQVRFLRRVFARIESAQKKILDKLQIDPLDERLGYVREASLRLFESAWARLNQKRLALNEDEFAELYLLCMAHPCQLRGIEIPAGMLPLNPKFENLIKEL